MIKVTDDSNVTRVHNQVLPAQVNTIEITYDLGRFCVQVNDVILITDNSGMTDFVVRIDRDPVPNE